MKPKVIAPTFERGNIGCDILFPLMTKLCHHDNIKVKEDKCKESKIFLIFQHMSITLQCRIIEIIPLRILPICALFNLTKASVWFGCADKVKDFRDKPLHWRQ